MTIDERQLDELMSESQDLQVDAMRQARETLPELREIGVTREPSTSPGFSLPGLGLLTGGFAAALAMLTASPAGAADSNQDVAILQTASSLERLAVSTYQAALGLPFIKDGNPVIVKFAQTTMSQHDAHRQAFQAQTKALNGTVQDMPNPVYAAIVQEALPGLQAPADVVKLAMTLENVATDTYLTDLTMLTDSKSKALIGSVMGVECQHLAVLRAVAALLAANAPQFIAIPVDLANLPAVAGSVAFPKSFEEPTSETVATPDSGAVK